MFEFSELDSNIFVQGLPMVFGPKGISSIYTQKVEGGFNPSWVWVLGCICLRKYFPVQRFLLTLYCIAFSVSRSTDQIQECLSLVPVMVLPVCGTLVLQVEQCGHFMVTREMLILWSSFQMAIDLELGQVMEVAGYLISELGTNSKYTINSMVILMSHMWPPFHSPYQEDFSLLDTQMAIAMCGTHYWQRYVVLLFCLKGGTLYISVLFITPLAVFDVFRTAKNVSVQFCKFVVFALREGKKI
jgi:hypothetical protein